MLQKPASGMKLVWSVWQRLGIHHNKHLVSFIFCQKHIIKTLLVGLFKETSACATRQPAVKQQHFEYKKQPTSHYPFHNVPVYLLFVLWVWFYKNIACGCNSFCKLFFTLRVWSILEQQGEFSKQALLSNRDTHFNVTHNTLFVIINIIHNK